MVILAMVYLMYVFPIRIMVDRLGYQWVHLPLKKKKQLKFVFKDLFLFCVSICVLVFSNESMLLSSFMDLELTF